MLDQRIGPNDELVSQPVQADPAPAASPPGTLWACCACGLTSTGFDSVRLVAIPFMVRALSYYEAKGKADACLDKIKKSAPLPLPPDATWGAWVSKSGEDGIINDPEKVTSAQREDA